MAKSTKNESLPDIAKISADGGKKTKVDGGIVKTGSGKGDEFSDFSFKEGNTATVKIQDIFVQEKGQAALRKLQDQAEPAAPRVKGGAKGKKKAASKSAGKKAVAGKKEASASGAKSVDKILKYTPNKSSSKKETPQKTAPAGKVSAKRTVSGGKKQTPAMPSPGGKQSTKTTDQMTMAQFKQYLDWHEKRKGGKTSSGGKVLGKRSAGKASATSGKASKASKRSKK